MNVRQNHQLNNQLNYYSRSSPRKHKRQPTRSLLTHIEHGHPPPLPTQTLPHTHPTIHSQNNNTNAHRPSQLITSMVIKDTTHNLILIEEDHSDQQHSYSSNDSPMNQIEIGQQQQEMAERVPAQRSQNVNKDQVGSSRAFKVQLIQSRHKTKINMQIKIEEDDQSNDQQNEHEVQDVNLEPITSLRQYHKVSGKNQNQEQGMSRQFTFAHQLTEREQQTHHSLEIRIEDTEQPELSFQQKIASISSLFLSQDKPQNKNEYNQIMKSPQKNQSPKRNQSPQENVSAQKAESNQKNESQASIKSKKKALQIDIMLIQEDQSNNADKAQNMEDYVSPKFNSISFTQELEEQWITKDNYQEKLYSHVEDSPKNQLSHLISIKQSISLLHLPQKEINQSSKQLWERPFGQSLIFLNEIMECVPQHLRPSYQQMRKKLITDQIQVEQKLRYQEHEAGVLKALLWLRKESINCEQYFVKPAQDKQHGKVESKRDLSSIKEIEVNKLMIWSLIRKISKKRIQLKG